MTSIPRPALPQLRVWQNSYWSHSIYNYTVFQILENVVTAMQLIKLSGESIVTLYAAPNPFLLNKVCLNQLNYLIRKILDQLQQTSWEFRWQSTHFTCVLYHTS